MKLKLDELVDMFDEIQNYEYIVYDKKKNDFIFIDLNMMSMQEYEELTDKIEEDEEERYYYLPSSYVFHDSELVEEYIDEIKNENIQDIQLKILAIDNNVLIVQWTLKQNNQDFDGIYEIKFNDNLKCIYFKSWEMVKEI